MIFCVLITVQTRSFLTKGKIKIQWNHSPCLTTVFNCQKDSRIVFGYLQEERRERGRKKERMNISSYIAKRMGHGFAHIKQRCRNGNGVPLASQCKTKNLQIWANLDYSLIYKTRQTKRMWLLYYSAEKGGKQGQDYLMLQISWETALWVIKLLGWWILTGFSGKWPSRPTECGLVMVLSYSCMLVTIYSVCVWQRIHRDWWEYVSFHYFAP